MVAQYDALVSEIDEAESERDKAIGQRDAFRAAADELLKQRDEARAQLANAAASEVEAVQGRQECECERELLEARARIEALESALRQYADREAWTDTVSELLEPEGPWEPEFPPSESLAHTVSVELHANTHFDYDGDGWELAEKALGEEDADV